MKNLKTNLQEAVETIHIMKTEDKDLRFRIETCVHKDSVKLYVIKKEKILKVITITDSKIVNVDSKGSDKKC